MLEAPQVLVAAEREVTASESLQQAMIELLEPDEEAVVRARMLHGQFRLFVVARHPADSLEDEEDALREEASPPPRPSPPSQPSPSQPSPPQPSPPPQHTADVTTVPLIRYLGFIR
jgi:hypothetical protein